METSKNESFIPDKGPKKKGERRVGGGQFVPSGTSGVHMGGTSSGHESFIPDKGARKVETIKYDPTMPLGGNGERIIRGIKQALGVKEPTFSPNKRSTRVPAPSFDPTKKI